MIEHINNISAACWTTLLEMAPYLLFGFFIAGMLSVFISPKLIERHLGGTGIWPVFKASLFGVPLPLCSCGVIPVATSLRKHGSSKGATTAFLLSTPQTGVDSIMATFSLLGPVFAIFRPLAAFITGLIGGSIVNMTEVPDTSDAKVEDCLDECCAPTIDRSKLTRIFHYGFIVLPKDIAKPFFVGLLIAGTIAAFIPEGFFASALGSGFLAMFVMMLLGIPMYVCATASIPVAAAMMMKGVTPGAALVFLLTGPATNAATIATLWKILGKRTTVIYIAVVAATALAAGLTLDHVFDISGSSAVHAHSEMLPHWFKILSAAVLLPLLAIHILPNRTAQGGQCCSHDEEQDHETNEAG
jgi:uncharacterized membrane protein YraQ (UPF0718 family)